eukprot:362379-Alexandrium_andersonii.AAC.1
MPMRRIPVWPKNFVPSVEQVRSLTEVIRSWPEIPWGVDPSSHSHILTQRLRTAFDTVAPPKARPRQEWVSQGTFDFISWRRPHREIVLVAAAISRRRLAHLVLLVWAH